MLPEHKAYWRTLCDRLLNDVELLLQKERDESAMLLMCSFLDAVPHSIQDVQRNEVLKGASGLFVERYLPAFGRVQAGDLLFDDNSNRRVNDCIDMLYFCYRNGLIHEGKLPIGISWYAQWRVTCSRLTQLE